MKIIISDRAKKFSIECNENEFLTLQKSMSCDIPRYHKRNQKEEKIREHLEYIVKTFKLGVKNENKLNS